MILFGAQGRLKIERGRGKHPCRAELRLQKDLDELSFSRFSVGNMFVRVRFPHGRNGSSKLDFVCEIFPQAGCYNGGRFLFNIKVPSSYPFTPPVVTCQTKILHPNIDWRTGRVGLPLLEKDWKPVLSMNIVIFGLQLLLLEPNFDQPITTEFNNLSQQQIQHMVTQTMKGGVFYNEKWECALADPAHNKDDGGVACCKKSKRIRDSSPPRPTLLEGANGDGEGEHTDEDKSNNDIAKNHQTQPFTHFVSSSSFRRIKKPRQILIRQKRRACGDLHPVATFSSPPPTILETAATATQQQQQQILFHNHPKTATTTKTTKTTTKTTAAATTTTSTGFSFDFDQNQVNNNTTAKPPPPPSSSLIPQLPTFTPFGSVQPTSLVSPKPVKKVHRTAKTMNKTTTINQNTTNSTESSLLLPTTTSGEGGLAFPTEQCVTQHSISTFQMTLLKSSFPRLPKQAVSSLLPFLDQTNDDNTTTTKNHDGDTDLGLNEYEMGNVHHDETKRTEHKPSFPPPPQQHQQQQHHHYHHQQHQQQQQQQQQQQPRFGIPRNEIQTPCVQVDMMD